MRPREVLWWSLKLLAQGLFILAFGVRVFGQRRVPESGGVLIVSNHQSYLDPILVGVGIQRPVSYMARRTLFRNPLFGWLIGALHSFPVTREGRDVEALREAVARLEAGDALVVFPEGTRTGNGTISPFRHGMLVIADRANVPIVPAMVEGAFEAWPRGKTPRLRRIRVAFGRTITAQERSGISREEAAGRVHEEMLRLQGQLKGYEAASYSRR